MPLQQLRVCNLGKTKANATGPTGVGYTLLDEVGSTESPRTTSGVYQTAPGIYAAYVTFPDDFRGQILWDTGSYFPQTYYAAEQYNVEENNPKVNGLYDMQFGRWKIEANQMIFYKDDNTTEIARFDLFDADGNPTMDAVFDRFRT
jgi:hypothetical protein